jgi:O-glycosyl hydrolase
MRKRFPHSVIDYRDYLNNYLYAMEERGMEVEELSKIGDAVQYLLE